MKYHRLGGLSKRSLFFTFRKVYKFKTKVLSGLVFGEASVPGLLKAIFSLCPPMAFLLCTCKEREGSLVSLPLVRKAGSLGLVCYAKLPP